MDTLLGVGVLAIVVSTYALIGYLLLKIGFEEIFKKHIDAPRDMMYYGWPLVIISFIAAFFGGIFMAIFGILDMDFKELYNDFIKPFVNAAKENWKGFIDLIGRVKDIYKVILRVFV